MYTLKMRIVVLAAIAPTSVQRLQAQDDCGDECRINTNLAMVINVPVNASSQAVGGGSGMAGGIGYNFESPQCGYRRVHVEQGLSFRRGSQAVRDRVAIDRSSRKYGSAYAY